MPTHLQLQEQFSNIRDWKLLALDDDRKTRINDVVKTNANE